MIRSLAPAALLALFACTQSGLQGPDGLSDADLGEVVEGEFIISADLPDGLLSELGLDKLDYDGALAAGLYRAHDRGVSRAALEATLKEKVRDTLRVEPNRPVRLSANDPLRPYQWNMDLLDIEAAWDRSTGEGVTVAVIDSGVSWGGEDRPGRLVAGWDYVDDDGDPADENGHGTHVAGTIAQATDNGRGVVGVAPDATVVAYRVLDRDGSGSVYWSAKAIRDATDAGADVINLSLGSPYGSSTEQSAVAYAASHGVIVVAASGNSGRNRLDYPAAYEETLAVGAVRADKRVTSYSNGGAGLDLVAPGGDLGVDQDRDGYADGVLQETLGGYEFLEGTSMATPHVAGAAALLLSAGAAPNEVRELLVETAEDLEGPGWNTRSGYGLLDVVAALEALGTPGAGTDPEPGQADTTAPEISDVGGTRSGGNLTLHWTTDEPATTQIEFEGYGIFGDDGATTTAHELSFTIDPGATYRFTLVATDAAGNTTRDGVWVSRP